MEPDERAPTAGLRDAAQQVVADLLEIGRTRLELAAVEIEEERLRIARLWIGAALTLALLFVGVMLAIAWVALVCDPAYRTAVVGGMSAAFLAAAALAAWRWRVESHRKPLLLHATLEELAHDSASIQRRPPHEDVQE